MQQGSVYGVYVLVEDLFSFALQFTYYLSLIILIKNLSLIFTEI